MRRRAIVFAYHNVGVRCLSVLLAHGVDVVRVVTHQDSPNETLWFDSVANLAARHDIPVIAVVGNDAGWTQIAREQVKMLHDDVATVLARSIRPPWP